jgi:hypothetical protein
MEAGQKYDVCEKERAGGVSRLAACRGEPRNGDERERMIHLVSRAGFAEDDPMGGASSLPPGNVPRAGRGV